MKVGIVTYGSYIPKFRVTTEEIANQWGKNAQEIERGLKVKEKSVPGLDEDTITISVEALRNALVKKDVDRSDIDALYIGSESHPYAVKPSSVTVAKALGMNEAFFTADLEFACKAGTAAMQIVASEILAKKIKYGIAVGADTAQGKPGDALEYTAAAGGAGFVLGSDENEIIAELNDFGSFTSDTPDFWRGKHSKYPAHAERFTGKPAYFKHIIGAVTQFLETHSLKPGDFDYAVFHMPNGKFPRTVAGILGFSEEQIQQSLVVDFIGNTYSGSSLLGLARVLDVARPGEKILVASYGSGSGSDVFSFTATQNIEKLGEAKKVDDLIEDKIYLTYGQYAKHTGKLH